METNNSNHSLESFGKHGGSTVVMIRSYDQSPSLFWIFLSVNLVLIVLGIILNVAICFVMLRKKRYERNTSNFFILHLSVTELVYRFLVFPVVVPVSVPALQMKSIHCKLASFFSETCSTAICVSLVAIATDRYQHIVHPLKTFKSKGNSVYLVSLVWLYASLVSLPHVISVESISVAKMPEGQGMSCNNCADKKLCDTPQNVMGRSSTTLYFLLAFLLPLTVVVLLYSKIFLSLKQRCKNGMIHQVAARSKSKAVRMLIITVFGYALSLGPTVIFAMLRSYGILNNASFKVMLLVNWLVELATYTSSLGNPLIYGYYNRDFRNELYRLFREKKAENVHRNTVTFIQHANSSRNS